MKRIIYVSLLFAILCTPVFAQEKTEKGTDKEAKKEAAKLHFNQHFKIYGFVRNYFSFDTRECKAGTGDLFNYMPLDNNWNYKTDAEAEAAGVEREDLNAQTSFRFLSLTTRVGIDVMNYKVGKTEFGGKIEADFYAGLTGVTGTAQLRLRQAYMTLAWDSLRMNDKSMARVQLLMGQAWHPVAADLADVINLNVGTPFGPFSRTPQVRMDARLGDLFTLTAAAIWQMQYTSAGPDGASANYIKYSATPEGYLGLNFHHICGILLRAGADVLSISPRHLATVKDAQGNDVQIKVNDRLTTVSPFLYLQYKHGEFTLKAKTLFAEAGEHVNLNGGYGVKRINDDGSWEYTPTRNSSSWITLTYGGKVGEKSKLQGILFGGYVRNFGTKEPLVDTAKEHFYFSKNSFTNLNRLWRVSPTLLWTIWKFQLGLEYEVTSAQYGENLKASNGLAEDNLHWVTNHKIQLMTKFNF